MFVIKRDGTRESVKFDKITARIQKLSYGLEPTHVDPILVAKKVIDGVYDGVSTSDLDNLAAETAASLTVRHPDYAQLASRIAVSNLHKKTIKSFSKTVESLYHYIDPKTGQKAGLIADDVYALVMENAQILDSSIIYDRDFGYDYFGFKTLERAYLFKKNDIIIERPQHMWMRVAIGIHMFSQDKTKMLDEIKETYNLMSQKYFTHATPTLFNAGKVRSQNSSCFLLQIPEDSLDSIFEVSKFKSLYSYSPIPLDFKSKTLSFNSSKNLSSSINPL